MSLRDKPDLVYSPGFAPPILSPFPSVVTVHDLIGMAFPGNQGAISSFYWSRWLPAAVRRARRVVASSESTRRDIERFLKIPPQRVSVVPLGVDTAFRKTDDSSKTADVLAKYRISSPFLISVSTLEPRKNHLRLLMAYEKLKQQGKNPFSLVIVGKPGGAETALHTFVKEKGLEGQVKFLGYLGQDELICLYGAAWGYAMISLYEGFGLPVLEAMSCGLSGICSKGSSLPEVAGDTALLVDPENVPEIVQAMHRFCSDAALRRRLSEAAWDRSKRFSTAECARQMIGIFKNEVQK